MGVIIPVSVFYIVIFLRRMFGFVCVLFAHPCQDCPVVKKKKSNFCLFSCQTTSSCWLHHRAQSVRSRVPPAAVWQVRWSELQAYLPLVTMFLWTINLQQWLVVFYMTQSCCWPIFPVRTKTLPCHRQSSETCFASVPTCHGVPKSTWLSQPQTRATSLGKATAVSGRKYLTQLWLSFHDSKHAHDIHWSALCSEMCLLHSLKVTQMSIPSQTGSLHTLTSTVAWST